MTTPIGDYLKAIREEAVKAIVERACQELPAYQQRDPQELGAAVGQSYDNWCESVLTNNYSYSVANFKTAIVGPVEI